jgi:hypothetical protein
MNVDGAVAPFANGRANSGAGTHAAAISSVRAHPRPTGIVMPSSFP